MSLRQREEVQEVLPAMIGVLATQYSAPSSNPARLRLAGIHTKGEVVRSLHLPLRHHHGRGTGSVRLPPVERAERGRSRVRGKPRSSRFGVVAFGSTEFLPVVAALLSQVTGFMLKATSTRPMRSPKAVDRISVIRNCTSRWTDLSLALIDAAGSIERARRRLLDFARQLFTTNNHLVEILLHSWRGSICLEPPGSRRCCAIVRCRLFFR